MHQILFDGQQTDERILYLIKPHALSKYLAILRLIFLALFFCFVLFLIASVVPAASGMLRLSGIILSIILLAVGAWWNNLVQSQDRTFITDRRIIRFDVVTPFFKTKRALFWNEALKAKAFAPNLLYRLLHVGTLVVEPQLSDHEDVRVTDVYYFEDLANYLDKILFTFKNKPEEINQIQPFVPKPRGERDYPAKK